MVSSVSFDMGGVFISQTQRPEIICDGTTYKWTVADNLRRRKSMSVALHCIYHTVCVNLCELKNGPV